LKGRKLTDESSRSLNYFLRRLVIALLLFLVGLTIVFAIIHLGPAPPSQAALSDAAASPEEQAAFAEKKRAFGLTKPLWPRYTDYLHDMFTLEFGESWSSRYTREDVRSNPITDVNVLVARHLVRTLWLWGWAIGIALVAGLPLGGWLGRTRSQQTSTLFPGSILLRAIPAFLAAFLLRTIFTFSKRFLGIEWATYLVDSTPILGQSVVVGSPPLGALADPSTALIAVKHVLPPALALSTVLLVITLRVGRRAGIHAERESTTDPERARGLGLKRRLTRLAHLSRLTARPLVSALPVAVGILIGATIFIEWIFELKGIGVLFRDAVAHSDFTTTQATMFVFLVFLVGSLLVRDGYYALTGLTDGEERATAVWAPTTSLPHISAWTRKDADFDRLRPIQGASRAGGIVRNIRATPRPAIIWLLGCGLLVAVEFGALADLAAAVLPGQGGIFATLAEVPTLLSRDLLPNRGHRTAAGGWAATAFGWSPATVWALRVALVYTYAAAWVVWVWVGLRIYRAWYRTVDRTTIDVILRRLRLQRRAQLGALILFVFVVAGLFAPTLGTTTLDRVGPDPATDGTVTYFDENIDQVTEVTVEYANTLSVSDDTEEKNIGLLSYDEFDRFHPLGTTFSGGDLFTDLLLGARIYLLMSIVALLLACGLTAVLVPLAAQYRGDIDRATSIASDGTLVLISLPFVLQFLGGGIEDVVRNSVGAFATELEFGLYLAPLPYALLFGLYGWAAIWVSIRGLAYRIVDEGRDDGPYATISPEEHADEESSLLVLYGRVLPSLVGHLTVSGLWLVCGVIATTAALSFLYLPQALLPYGLGRQMYEQVAVTAAWPQFVMPAVALLSFLIGLLALADAVQYAIDPDEQAGTSSVGELARKASVG
jgi:peptide/nickel transport system permease protein